MSRHKEAERTGEKSKWSERFDYFACQASYFAGRASTFSAATLLVVGWAFAGPFFGFSESWQLVINTSTTIITFLMVFIIQHAQNRDTAAIQLKLSELIVAIKDADNHIADAEEMNEEEIKAAKDALRLKH